MIKVLGEQERNAKEGSTCGYADGDAKVKRTVREARQSGTQHRETGVGGLPQVWLTKLCLLCYKDYKNIFSLV